MPPEPPITTTATITGAPNGRSFPAELPNGKRCVAFATRKTGDLVEVLGVGDRVTVELTPFDFSKGRIVGRAGSGDDSRGSAKPDQDAPRSA